ncbi:dienelactone hydrolase family protein [Legionella clemsonensis]|uniref:dienelactone hydrolase family protein n=1 Tax=Legionella clemsonensis TaxID=1867846 RepID=UPI002FC64BCF
MPIGYFGASTGAAAALIASTELEQIKAVVSRGGRPDLADEFLPSVKAPTLLIVGGNDNIVISLNEEALSKLKCINQLEIVPGATHLFEEADTLNQAAQLARDWFIRYLTHPSQTWQTTYEEML